MLNEAIPDSSRIIAKEKLQIKNDKDRFHVGLFPSNVSNIGKPKILLSFFPELVNILSWFHKK